MQMEMFMMETGKTTKLTDSEFIHIWMEQGMKVNGRKTNNMVKVLKHGTMGPHIKVLM